MGFMTLLNAIGLTTLTIGLLPPVLAHSWIEEYQVIDANGSYIGDRGYSRGYVARTNVTGGYDGFSMDYLVPQTGVRINTSDSLCHPAQRTSNYSNPLYPKLQVAPGNYVAMKYLENGHVTLPWNQAGKPKAAGTVFVYGTTQPASDEKMADVLAWTNDGKGGNGKGWLMTAQNFDDGRCHQINCGNISLERQSLFPTHVAGQPTSSVEQWCETNLKIPDTQASGSLTTYWVWQWSTAPNADCGAPEGKDEYYTTCADFDIISNGSGNADVKIAAEPDTHTLAQENPQSTAVSDFQSRTAYTTSPEFIVIEGTKTVGPVVTAKAAFMNSCSAGPVAPNINVPASCDPVSVFTGAAITAASASTQQSVTTPPATAPQPSTVTISSTTTTTFTTSSVITQTTYVPTAAGTSISFSTLTTVSAVSSLPTTTASNPAAAGPTVGADGMVEDAFVATGRQVVGEHLARHRGHARHFH